MNQPTETPPPLDPDELREFFLATLPPLLDYIAAWRGPVPQDPRPACQTAPAPPPAPDWTADDAVSALVNLGMKKRDALARVRSALAAGRYACVTDLIAACLKRS